MWNDFLSLIYPELCAACGNTLFKHEEGICNNCFLDLPQTNYHLNPENPLYQKLYGRFRFNAACAYYTYTKGGKVQRLLHELKYSGNKEAGLKAGIWFGKSLVKTSTWSNMDYILPVPLHPKKLLQRGYNQSTIIAQGISLELNVPVNEEILKRRTFTNTQTKKGREDRWENVSTIFECNSKIDLSNKRIMIVDDVVTTGSTIEACASLLHVIEGVELYVAALAFTQI